MMWNNVEKTFCIEAYISSKSYRTTRSLYLKKFGFDRRKADQAPSKTLISKWLSNFQAGTLERRRGSGRKRSVRTEDNISSAKDSVLSSPKRSVRHRSQALGVSKSSLHRILKRDLHMRPYKLQLCQKLTVPDQQKRLRMAKWFEQHSAVLDRVWFSDEAHFWLTGHVNSQNAVHWGTEKPDEVLTAPLHSEKVTVWMAMRRGGGVIGPFFFEDENGDVVTVNQERYVQQALVPFWEKLGEKVGADRREEWFQQDGATPHTAQKSLQWLKEKFDKRLISLKTDVEWSPNSPDLSPLDFFLWGYMKDRVYAHKPRSTHELKEAIRSEARQIPQQMIDNAVTHLETVRLPMVLRRKGSHLEHLL